MIRVIIKELKFRAIIGLLQEERHKEQELLINALMLAFDDEFIDYALACELIKTTIKNGRFKTVEEALKACGDSLKKEFAFLKRLEMEILKIEILPDAIVGAKIELDF